MIIKKHVNFLKIWFQAVPGFPPKATACLTLAIYMATIIVYLAAVLPADPHLHAPLSSGDANKGAECSVTTQRSGSPRVSRRPLFFPFHPLFQIPYESSKYFFLVSEIPCNFHMMSSLPGSIIGAHSALLSHFQKPLSPTWCSLPCHGL